MQLFPVAFCIPMQLPDGSSAFVTSFSLAGQWNTLSSTFSSILSRVYWRLKEREVTVYCWVENRVLCTASHSYNTLKWSWKLYERNASHRIITEDRTWIAEVEGCGKGGKEGYCVVGEWVQTECLYRKENVFWLDNKTRFVIYYSRNPK